MRVVKSNGGKQRPMDPQTVWWCTAPCCRTFQLLSERSVIPKKEITFAGPVWGLKRLKTNGGRGRRACSKGGMRKNAPITMRLLQCATRQFFAKKTRITRTKLFFHLPGGHQNQQATSKTTASQSVSCSQSVRQACQTRDTTMARHNHFTIEQPHTVCCSPTRSAQPHSVSCGDSD